MNVIYCAGHLANFVFFYTSHTKDPLLHSCNASHSKMQMYTNDIRNGMHCCMPTIALNIFSITQRGTMATTNVKHAKLANSLL